MTVVARLGMVVGPAGVAVGSCRRNSGEAGKSRRNSGAVVDRCHMSPGGWEVEGGDRHMPSRCRNDLAVGSSRVAHSWDSPCNPRPEDTAWAGQSKPIARSRTEEKPGDYRKSLAC